MRCARFEGWIQKKLDGELEAHQQVALEKHLKTCERCRTMLADYEELAHMLEAAVPATCEPLASSILERLEAERPRPARFVLRFALTAAAAVVCALVIIFIARRAEPRPEPGIVREERAPKGIEGIEAPSFSDLLAIEPPSVLDDSTQVLAENLETLKRDAGVAGKTILDVFEEIERQLPLI